SIYGLNRTLEQAAGEHAQSASGVANFEQLVRLSSQQELDASDRPVVQAVDYLLRSAFDNRASDIHIEPRRDTSLVRLRIDGVLPSRPRLEASDRPGVQAVDSLLRSAFDTRASDIHIEPRRDTSLVRLRIDGVLHPVHTLPGGVHLPLVSRVKMLARMDISEK